MADHLEKQLAGQLDMLTAVQKVELMVVSTAAPSVAQMVCWKAVHLEFLWVGLMVGHLADQMAFLRVEMSVARMAVMKEGMTA